MIIEAFTREEGRVSFFAPGIRHVSSRRAGHLETLMETNLVLVSSKRGNSLSEARVIKTFPMLRTDYDRLEVVYDIVKTLRHYTGEGQGDTKLYDVVINWRKYWLFRSAAFVHLGMTKFWNESTHRIGELQFAFFDQHHAGN